MYIWQAKTPAAALYPEYSDDMWEISIGSQAQTFIYALLLGAILCFIYDIIRVTRVLGADSFVAVFIGDVFFWLVSAVTVFIFLIATTNGEIRGYVLWSGAVGFLLYRFTIGRIVFKPIRVLLCFIARVIKKASDISARFCLLTEGCLNRFFIKVIGFLKAVFRAVKKVLKNVHSLVYYTNKHKNQTGNDFDEQRK